MNSAAVLRHNAPEPALPAVRLRGFFRTFGTARILDNLDLEIAPGEFLAILGRSGSGKTTLLRALAGLDDVRDQEIMVPSSRATVFQDARLLPWKRVWQNVTLGIGRPTARAEAERALGEVGLSHRLDAWPYTLSGGEAHRVALARALIRNPGLLLLDEPFAALDALTRIKMHSLVKQLWNMHKPSVVLVTHDIEEAVALADRVLVLREGRFACELSMPAKLDDSRSLDPALKAKLIDEIG